MNLSGLSLMLVAPLARLGKPALVVSSAGASAAVSVVSATAGVSETNLSGVSLMLVAPLARFGKPASVVAAGASAAVSVASATAGVSETNLSGVVLTLVAPFERLGKPASVVAAGASAAVSVASATAGASVEACGSKTTAGSSAMVSPWAASTASVRRATASEVFSSIGASLAVSVLSSSLGKSMKAMVPRRSPSPASAFARRTLTPISSARRPTTNKPRYADGASAKSTGFSRRSLTCSRDASSMPMP